MDNLELLLKQKLNMNDVYETRLHFIERYIPRRDSIFESDFDYLTKCCSTIKNLVDTTQDPEKSLRWYDVLLYIPKPTDALKPRGDEILMCD